MSVDGEDVKLLLIIKTHVCFRFCKNREAQAKNVRKCECKLPVEEQGIALHSLRKFFLAYTGIKGNKWKGA